ncbi:hypothetical protein B296_00033937, partial [Ensete ventricosum]
MAVRIGPPGYQYADRLLPGGTAKIDRRRLISAVGGRLREKKGRRRRGKEEKRRGEERRIPHFPALSLLARCPRPQATLLPCEETKRLPARGERSRR